MRSAAAARAHDARQGAAQPRRGGPQLDPTFDPNAAIQDHGAEIDAPEDAASASAGQPPARRLDAKEFAERLPGRVNKVMDALAEGQLTLNIQGIDERELMRGIQKLANRVTAAVVVAVARHRRGA